MEWTLAAAAGSVLQISDAAGRTLQTHVLPEDAVQYQINVSGLPPGIYYLRVSDGRNGK